MDDPPRVRLARLPTPFEAVIEPQTDAGRPRIWVKRDDLTEGPAGGNKLRKLEYAIGQARADGADVLITAGASQSNHCRQTAFAAARLGLGCHLILSEDHPPAALDGNLLLDQLMGATITSVTSQEFDELPAIFDQVAEQYRARGSRPFVIPVGASDEIGLWGYINAARELKADFDACDVRPSHIVAAVGSGGTHAGLMLGADLAGLETEILGISVSRSSESLARRVGRLHGRWSERYGIGLPPSSQSVEILDQYVAPGYGLAAPEVYQTIKRVAGRTGLVLDPVYGGKAFHGLERELATGRFDGSTDIVFLHTGGIYGVFPHRKHFA